MSPSTNASRSSGSAKPTPRVSSGQVIKRSKERVHIKSKFCAYLRRIVSKAFCRVSKSKVAKQESATWSNFTEAMLPGDAQWEDQNDPQMEEIEDIYWSGVKNIKDQELIDLAIKHLGSTHGSTCSVLDRLDGSYNRAHIMQFEDGFKFVIRVPACGSPGRWTKEDAFAIRSQALTMNYIRRHTNLPVPAAISYSNTCDNDFGHPYIITSFLHGQQVSEVWGDAEGYGPDMEEKRRRILYSLAHTMSEFQKLSFNASGSLYFEHDLDDDPQIGPRYMVDQSDYPNRRTYFEPSYNNTRQHLRERLAKWWEATQSEYDPHSVDLLKGTGEYKILQMAVDCVPSPKVADDETSLKSPSIDEQQSTSETFVLVPPDFDWQNILVDEQGNITALLDWDEVYTQPRFAGFASSPMWITRDYLSAGYEWHGDVGNSDWDLARYRKMYSQFMCEAMNGKGDCKFTQKCHLFQLVQYACENENKMSWVGVENILKPILGRTGLEYYVCRIGNEAEGYGFKTGEEVWLESLLAQLFQCEPIPETRFHI